MGMLNARLYDTIKSYGYHLESLNSAPDMDFAFISGKSLGHNSAVIRSSDKICNISIVIGILDAIPSPHKESIAIDALELNAIHPLARISALKVSGSDGQETRYYMLLIAETSFFHTEMTQEKFDARADAVDRVGFAFSKSLSSKGFLSQHNPWYSRLQTGTEPSPSEYQKPGHSQ